MNIPDAPILSELRACPVCHVSGSLACARDDCYAAPNRKSGPPDVWIQTLPRRGERTGRALDLVNPTPDMIDFGTIATILARVSRFGGHTGGGTLSVAQHCIEGTNAILRETGRTDWAAAFAIHDAHEAYIGDIATPVAQALQYFADQDREFGVVKAAIYQLKHRLDSAIYQAAGLPWPLPSQTTSIVKLYDRRMLETERRARMADPPHPWTERAEQIEGADLYPWSEGVVRPIYLGLLHALLPALGKVRGCGND